MTEQQAISSEEIALYDRQIRLWGMEAQTRMRNARVLVVNCGALANEIIKNIVLAGIGSLTILDSSTVSAADLGAEFFINSDSIGKSRAEAALPAIQKLNPRVAVSCETTSVLEKDSVWYAQFDVTIGTQLTYPELEYLNTHTSRAAAPTAEDTSSSSRLFYATSISGLYGFCFADLGESYTFTVQQERSTTGLPKTGTETRTRTAVSVTPATSKEGKVITDTILKSESYVPASRLVVTPDFPTPISLGPLFQTARRLLKVSPLLPVFLGLFQIQSKNANDQEAPHVTSAQLKEAALGYARLLQIPAGVVTDAIVDSFLATLNAELSPVAAILGGVVAQQVLNAISKKQQPLQNFLVFDGVASTGPVYTLL